VIAAELTGRRAAGFDLDPRYVDCVVRRWQQMTGRTPFLLKPARPSRWSRMPGRRSSRRWPMADDYEVGYGKPQRLTRFRKGQSGNLLGRLKGSTTCRPR
jgi:hypothetical protein